MDFLDRLDRARTGGAILFCGAGFSAECLNLEFDEKFGVGNDLLKVLNAKLDAPRNRLDRAASAYRQKFGEHGLRDLLQARFEVSHVPTFMLDILSYPWSRIYTTNYDNAIEMALERVKRRKTSLSNVNSPAELQKDSLAVIHLHGFLQDWSNLAAFEKSCVLTSESYYQVRETLGPWLETLQADYAGSRLFVFAGFAASDLRINQILFDRTPRDKVYFVNRPTPQSRLETDEDQKDFGTPIYIGNAGLAEHTRVAVARSRSNEPYCPSFLRYIRPEPATAVPSVNAIQELIIDGHIDPSQIVRDLLIGTSDYHVLRKDSQRIVSAIAAGKNPILLTGEICDGKTLLIEALAARLSATGRPIFFLRSAYDTVVEETVAMITAYPDTVIIAESCFELGADRLRNLVTIAEGSKATLILTSRSISAEAEVVEFEILSAKAGLAHIRLQGLDDDETQDLARLADQIAGFTGLPGTPAQQVDRIRKDCQGRLPRFLAELMKSKVVINRYAEEYTKISSLTQRRDMMVLIAALYMTHIGHDPTVSTLSNMLSVNCERVIERIDSAHPRFKLMRIYRDTLRTVPSLGARAILTDIIPASDPRIVVDTVVEMLRSLGGTTRQGQMVSVFQQLMRYSVISKVVLDTAERNRFFDNVSKIDSCRSYVLFWVQWHMAMVDQKRWNEAEIYLERSYTEADNHDRRKLTGPKFDRFQIDDRKSKFLMIRDTETQFRPQMIKDVEQACLIAHRLMAHKDMSHHPFDTLSEIVKFLQVHGPRFSPIFQDNTRKWLAELTALAEKRKGMLATQYRQDIASTAINAAQKWLASSA